MAHITTVSHVRDERPVLATPADHGPWLVLFGPLCIALVVAACIYLSLISF